MMEARPPTGLRSIFALASLLLAAGLATPGPAPGAAAPQDSAPPAADTLEGDAARQNALPLVVDYPVFRAVEPPSGYREALEQGTRSEDGTPGPDYWQQEVHYRIDVELDVEAAEVRGTGTVEYVNNSPEALGIVFMNLHQNVFSEGVRRNRPVEVTGGMHLERVEAAGRELEEVDQQEFARRAQMREETGGYNVEGTVGAILLPAPLPPGSSVELAFRWAFDIPAGDPFRMGRIERDIYNIAQWYPQIATYDDVHGPYVSPYLGDGEFYLEYGSFEVNVRVPEGWLVAATGVLGNPEDVLREETRERLEEALDSEEVVRVVTREERDEGLATAPATAAGESLVWSFRADSVRDFAFAASDRYVWDAVGADVGGERGRVLASALYDPELEHWEEAAGYARHSVEFFSDYILPYPYPHATAVYGPVGGMEYPMVVFIGASQPGEPLYSVIAHEFSHEWFPMLVGAPEADYAWMDEGLTSFNESLAFEDFFEHRGTRESHMESYRNAVEAGVEAPLMRHTDYVENDFGRAVAAYTKPSVLLHALRELIGTETFDAAYRSYADAWSYRHPLPWDFFAVMEEEAGEDLDWFWKPWFYETVTLDQAIEGVENTESGGARVTVANRSDAVMPVLLEIETADGAVREERWPVSVWGGTREVARDVEVGGEAVRVTLDPEGILPDIDRTNQTWER